jgi:hypothetical protein
MLHEAARMDSAIWVPEGLCGMSGEMDEERSIAGSDRSLWYNNYVLNSAGWIT